MTSKAMGVGIALAGALAAAGASAQTLAVERHGPHGLEGRTVLVPIEDRGNLPMTLVLKRHGRRLHRFSGDPFVWRWIFLDDGARVAYESGPLHFAMTCVLAEVGGKELARYDCFSEPLAADAPEWVRQLKASR